MENRLSTRISRIFRGSFGSSCRTRNLSDVAEKAVFIPHRQNINNDENGSVSSLKARPFPTICRAATCPETATQVINHCTIPSKRKESHQRRYPPLVPNSGKGFPPDLSSPVSPLTRSYYRKKQSTQKQGTKSKKKKKKRGGTQKRETSSLISSSSLDSVYFGGSYYWFSSEDEDEGGGKGDKNGYENDDESDTLFFSSRSLSSDSSALSASRRHRNRRNHRREGYATVESDIRREIDNSKKGVAKAAAGDAKSGDKSGKLPLEGKVKGSFAVVKSSSDPYNDFRTSMVEMIIEKQIFGAKDLEQLLQCFLTLNSDHHHRIIVEVFTEIWEALFSTFY
ncbi:unnamed protein product [Linum tenue]|uniref:Transcription repressor n=1 Tax=Linum tenue TaxID=586396 RepID=A0AAV0HXI5_9ROSI|nr:unnamed protein product [Linum tenue]